MSALRYSGALRIRITYVKDWTKAAPEYRCHISCPSTPGQLPCTIYVRRRLTHNRNSPIAFDEAAKSALSHAYYEGWPVDSYAAYDGGWVISRSVKNSHVWL